MKQVFLSKSFRKGYSFLSFSNALIYCFVRLYINCTINFTTFFFFDVLDFFLENSYTFILA